MACECEICKSYRAIPDNIKNFCFPPLKPEENHLSPKFEWKPDVSEANKSKYGS